MRVALEPPPLLHVHCSLTTPGCPGASSAKQLVQPAVLKLPRQPAGQAISVCPGAVHRRPSEQMNSSSPFHVTARDGQQDE